MRALVAFPSTLRVITFLWGIRICELASNSTFKPSPRCPCASLDQLSPLSGNISAYVPIDYGIECRKHDSNSKFFGECHQARPMPWCEASWCYIVPGHCDIGFDQSALVPRRVFSYETCGNFNYFSTHASTGSWAGKTINIVKMSNTGGWKGSFCINPSDCHGLVYDFIMRRLPRLRGHLIDAAVFNTSAPTLVGNEHALPLQVMNQFRLDHPTSRSSFTACVYAAGMGYVDLCIGAFILTPERRKISTQINILSQPMHLVAPRHVKKATFWDEMWSFTEPLSGYAWLCLVVAFMLLSLMMMWHNYDRRTIVEGGFLETILRFLSAMVVGASSLLVKDTVYFAQNTQYSRVTALGFSVLVFFTIVFFTANLTASLVVEEVAKPDIGSIAEAVDKGVKVCLQVMYMKALFTLHPHFEGTDLFVPKISRSDVLAKVGTECHVALVPKEDIDSAQSHGEHCDLMYPVSPELHINVGVPVSDRIYSALQYELTRGIIQGELAAMETYMGPIVACGSGKQKGVEGLSLQGLIGTITVSLFLGFSGLFFAIGHIYKVDRQTTVFCLGKKRAAAFLLARRKAVKPDLSDRKTNIDDLGGVVSGEDLDKGMSAENLVNVLQQSLARLDELEEEARLDELEKEQGCVVVEQSSSSIDGNRPEATGSGGGCMIGHPLPRQSKWSQDGDEVLEVFDFNASSVRAMMDQDASS